MSNPRPTAAHREAWRFASAIAAEIALRGNHRHQSVYVHLSTPDEWAADAVVVWRGDGDAQDMTPVMRMGDMDALWVWDGRYPSADPRSYNEPGAMWAELWPDAKNRPVAQIVDDLCARAGIDLCSGSPGDGRFGSWARLFAAGIDCFHLLPWLDAWTAHTLFHSGWGTYYLAFEGPVAAVPSSIALSEEGHFTNGIMPTLNLRRLAEAGMSRAILANELAQALSAWVSENHGPPTLPKTRER